MKNYILIAVLSFCSVKLAAQSDLQIRAWLYDLPVKKTPEKIRKSILKNDNFETTNRNQNTTSRYFSSTYAGRMMKPNLPIQGRLDSAKVKLNVGTVNTTDGYSGAMKWVRFEYFSADTVYLNKLFDTACTELKQHAVTEKPSGFRIRDEALGMGINYIYFEALNELRSISVLRVRYTSGAQSVSVSYGGSDK